MSKLFRICHICNSFSFGCLQVSFRASSSPDPHQGASWPCWVWGLILRYHPTFNFLITPMDTFSALNIWPYSQPLYIPDQVSWELRQVLKFILEFKTWITIHSRQRCDGTQTVSVTENGATLKSTKVQVLPVGTTGIHAIGV